MNYGPYQKFPLPLPELATGRHPTQISLPAMSFEIKGLAYDAGRKLVLTQFAKTRPPQELTKRSPVHPSICSFSQT